MALAQAQHRVVVTGIGAISSMGLTFEDTWTNILNCYSGVRKNDFPNFPNIPCRVAAKVARTDDTSVACNNDPVHNKNPSHLDIFNPKEHMTRNESYYTDPNIQYALMAASEAMRTSGLDSYLQSMSQCDDDQNKSDDDLKLSNLNPSSLSTPPHLIDRYRIGVSFATALGGIQTHERDYEHLCTDQMRKISPYMVSNLVINTAGSAISLRYGLRGPNLASATACAASAHAIQRGLHLIQHGICDIVVVGGTEASISKTFIAELCRCKALSTKYNDEPHKASRPWDRDRDGFVMGEGAAVLVLESETMAKQRGVTDIYGEIVGAASTADAFHCTGLDPSGIPVQKCMELAVENGVRNTRDDDLIHKLGYINAHGTSTDIGDKTELKAILGLLEQNGYRQERIKISSTKSSIGHMLGAAGAMEAALSLKALQTNMVPPTLNLEHQDEFVPENVNLVPNTPQPLEDEFEYAMSNSFGFGGTNASLLFKKRNRL